MKNQGYVIVRDKTASKFFTTSSSYDRPQWVPLEEATVFLSPDMANAAAKKLWKYGAYSAKLVPLEELASNYDRIEPSEITTDDDPTLDELPAAAAYGEEGGDVDGMCGCGDPECDNPDCEGVPGEESAYGDDSEGDAIPAMDGEPSDDESAYGADGESEGDAIPAMDSETDLESADGEVSMSFDMPDEEVPQKRKPTMEAVAGERTFQTYPAWKRAVKAIDPAAEFYGDKDIGGAKGIGEWDGAEGVIFDKATIEHHKQTKTAQRSSVDESMLTELRVGTLKAYMKNSARSIANMVAAGDMVNSTKRAKKVAWASSVIKNKSTKGVKESVEQLSVKDPASGDHKLSPISDAHDAKVTVPANIKSSLAGVVADFRKEANDTNERDNTRASFCLTVADALQQLLDDLSSGTVSGIKQAQIHMSSYMSPITQHIPAEVVKFIVGGGQKSTLKNLFAGMKESARTSYDDMADQYVNRR
jgi:hypothetical protein